MGEPVGDGPAVEGERLGPLAVLGLEPLVQAGGEGVGVDPAEERAEHLAARRDAGFFPRRPVVAAGFALAGVALLGQAHEVGGRWRPMRIARQAMVSTVARR